MKNIPPTIDMEAELRKQAQMEADVRFGQGWLSAEVTPPSSGKDAASASSFRGDGGSVVQGPGGGYGSGMDYGSQTREVVSVDKPSEAESDLLPFEITVTADTLKAAPGVIAGGVGGGTVPETTQASPANGVWYLEAKVTINDTTGAITAVAAQWTATTPSTDTSTNYHAVLGEVEVVSGEPDPSTIINYNYGPLLVVVHGAAVNKWGAYIF